MRTRNINELLTFKTFEDRYNYLKLGSSVGETTFGYDRYLNQLLYRSKKWRRIRDSVIIRDKGCDLALEDRPIFSNIIIHHMNPISLEDVESDNSLIYNSDFLICTSLNTHNAIHYGDSSLLQPTFVERSKNDMAPWLT